MVEVAEGLCTLEIWLGQCTTRCPQTPILLITVPQEQGKHQKLLKKRSPLYPAASNTLRQNLEARGL